MVNLDCALVLWCPAEENTVCPLHFVLCCLRYSRCDQFWQFKWFFSCRRTMICKLTWNHSDENKLESMKIKTKNSMDFYIVWSYINKLPFWPGCFDPAMTSDPSSFAIPVQSIASFIAFSSSLLLIPRKDATSVSSSCCIIAWAISALSYCSSASMHAWDKISSFGNGRSSLNSSALQTCDKCKSSIGGRMRSSAGF